MLPEAKSQDLLYVVRGGEGTVSVFTFPKRKPVGALSNIPGAFGICSDTTGDVFVVARENDEIYEFAHGGTKPIATLDDFGNDANGCAVDPASGNLAVAGGLKAGQGDANAAVYQHARGSPTLYKSSAPQFTFSTYDSQGNVFMGGEVLFELPQGSNSFVQISVPGVREFAPSDIQWDGSYIALQGTTGSKRGPTTIYQIQVSGSTGTIVKQVSLTSPRDKNPYRGAQFWIGDGTIVGPEDTVRRVGLWRYPKGGRPFIRWRSKKENRLSR